MRTGLESGMRRGLMARQKPVENPSLVAAVDTDPQWDTLISRQRLLEAQRNDGLCQRILSHLADLNAQPSDALYPAPAAFTDVLPEVPFTFSPLGQVSRCSWASLPAIERPCPHGRNMDRPRLYRPSRGLDVAPPLGDPAPPFTWRPTPRCSGAVPWTPLGSAPDRAITALHGRGDQDPLPALPGPRNFPPGPPGRPPPPQPPPCGNNPGHHPSTTAGCPSSSLPPQPPVDDLLDFDE
ncbi:wiskott-Aldrich syndrome protein family member 2-like [Rhipicephalus sanguineus]|uniref:wiskott-Aldrich syndrome protein family member 2-like n=1 Tax=Rhipicephalus sanguineus TaxID=34632 RepID=UPI0020C4FADA|nr:wiskott-Aldrich syndrome protein family member 2-like [Rhipicephalus sanguineus]